MCSVCGGVVCAGTGGCSVVINNAPEVVKITYSQGGNLFYAIQTYLGATFIATKETLKHSFNLIRRGILRKG